MANCNRVNLFGCMLFFLHFRFFVCAFKFFFRYHFYHYISLQYRHYIYNESNETAIYNKANETAIYNEDNETAIYNEAAQTLTRKRKL